MDITDALHSKTIFGPLFKDPKTWHAWEVFLRGLFGLPIESAEDLALFRDCTGLEDPPRDRARESYVIAGRRSGKSFTSALIAVFLACFKDWRSYLSPGERGWIFIIAVDKSQAGVIKSYVSGIFHRVKCLRGQIAKETQESIELGNGISIGVKTASFRSVRGYTILAAILEELAFYRSEESANPDREILAAVRPALATIPDGLLLGITTPYSKSGVAFQMWRDYYGKTGGPLVWRASTRTMNPTIDGRLIENALKEDPQAARAEWEAEWREDIEAFITQELVEAVMIPGRFELPKIEGANYYGFIDPSGGRQDSFTMGICHRETSGRIVLDVIRERRPPFQPQGIVAEFSDVLRSFKISSVGSDRFAGEWVPEAFRKHGIEVKAADMTASEFYLNFLPLVSNGTVELLDNKRLLAQLVGLERRARSGGKDLITHYAGGHDDVANAAAGAIVTAEREAACGRFYAGGGGRDVSPGYGDERETVNILIAGGRENLGRRSIK
jgi:hypothetical protein